LRHQWLHLQGLRLQSMRDVRDVRGVLTCITFVRERRHVHGVKFIHAGTRHAPGPFDQAAGLTPCLHNRQITARPIG